MKIHGQSFQEQTLSLREMWQSTIPGECPAVQQFGTWLAIHNRNVERIEWAIRELAIKLTKRSMDDDYKIKFVSSIMNAKAKTQEATR